MEEKYLKLASIKLSINDNKSQAREIYSTLNSFSESELINFNFSSLSNIYNQNVIQYLYEIFLNLPSCDINFSSIIFMCSQFQSNDIRCNDELVSIIMEKLISICDGEILFKLLQNICLKYPLLMKELISSEFLNAISSLSEKFEVKLFEKNLLLVIQELSEINTDVLSILSSLTREMDVGEDYFLKLISSVSVTSVVTKTALTSEILWNTILKNLKSPQTIDRKRATYWLNRALYSSKNAGLPKLCVQLSNETLELDLQDDIISNILILIDTLEEKQTHIILPVLAKIDNLKNFFLEGRMTVNWLLSVIEKAFLHDSTVILKWAISQFLSLPIELSSFSYTQIILSSFVKTLNQSNLYFSIDSVTNDGGFFASKLLDDFLQRLFNELTIQPNNDLLHRFLDAISTYSWNSSALLFFSESFSKILLPHSKFSLRVASSIGSLCRLNLVTMNLKYRQCITSFLLSGFLHNHVIEADQISKFANILYTNFNVPETILDDSTLINQFSTKMSSLSSEDCSKIWEKMIEIIKDSEINDLNFSTIFNKVSCMSLWIVMTSTAVSKYVLLDFIDFIVTPIKQTHMNPYANFFTVLKAVVCLKQLHMVVKVVPLNTDTFGRMISDAILSVFLDVTTYLALQIEQSVMNDEAQNNCVSLLRYIINNFPKPTVNIYFTLAAGNRSLEALIAANIAEEVDGMFGNLDIASLVKRQKTVGTISALKYEKLKCLARYFEHYKSEFKTTKAIEDLVDFLCELVHITVHYKGLVSVIDLCGAILDHLFDSTPTEVTISMIKCIWKSLLDHNSNAQIFWKLYSAFLEKVFKRMLNLHHRCSSNESVLSDCLSEIIDVIFEMGENKFGLVNLLGQTFHEFFMFNRMTPNESLWDFYIEVIGRLVLYGPCHRRGLRSENRIERYLNAKYGDRWKAHRINKVAESSERVGGVLILCLKEALPLPFKEKMILYLRKRDTEIAGNNSKGYKNYANNHIHRTRHRLFSALLVLLDSSLASLSSSCLDQLEQWMLLLIQNESLNSIRHFSEWVYILLCIDDLSKQTRLLDTIRAVTDSKPAYVCSLITICRHIVVIRNDFIEDFVLSIFPLGSAQNYNVRLYAMTFINIVHQQKLINPSKKHLIDITTAYVSFLDRGILAKNVQKLMDNFWWSKFDPRKDVCLETVLSILPSLFELVEEEIIFVDQLRMLATQGMDRYAVKFDNERSEWDHVNESVWRVKLEASNQDEEYSTAVTVGSDVQKKIQPWITCRPDEDLLSDLYGVTVPASDLVLVCSLIEKATNIGGLARTSNIFGVGEFVVGNLRVTEDISFKQLAVTADKWINMTEVGVRALARFIAVKRAEGYEIVGIEQTANSVGLQAMEFKSKTVLLLGNEKEGIPADLISHMDKCIQIPQVGQVRSLNVHVSGALVLWEYMKQMRLSQ